MKVHVLHFVILVLSVIGADAFFRNPCNKKRRDILCRRYKWRCPRDCTINGKLIKALRSIADPYNKTKPDLKYDLDKDGTVTLLDFVILLNKTLVKHNPKSLIPGGNLTQYVLDNYKNSSKQRNDRAMTMMTTDGTTTTTTNAGPRNVNGRKLQPIVCSGDGDYNGYQRGTSPPNRPWRPKQDFVFNPNITPRWYDYFLFVATLDLAGLTSLSVLDTNVLTSKPMLRIGAYLILDAVRSYIEIKYLGTDEGLAGFRHYLLSTGTTLTVDYLKAVNEDPSISNTYNLELREAKDAARALRGDKNNSSFQLYNTNNRKVNSSTVNWNGAFGQHTIWSQGTAIYNGSTCSIKTNITVTIKDLFDFNRDDDVIGEAAKQASNVFGRFTIYGWAKPFTTEATTSDSDTTTLQCCQDSDCGDPTEFDCTCNICGEQCPSTQLSGGQGFSVFAVDLKKTKGTFVTTFDMYRIPDALDIFYEGRNVYSTGGLLSNGKTVQVTYGTNATITTTVFIQINAPEDATAWVVSVECPP